MNIEKDILSIKPQPEKSLESLNHEQEPVEIQNLGDFDLQYFQELQGEDGWIAIGQEKYQQDYKNQKYFTVFGTNGEKLGIIAVYDAPEVDLKNVIHVVVDPKYRGQGLSAKFQKRIMDELNLPFITVTINTDNIASIRATEKLPGAKRVSDKKYEDEFHQVKYVCERSPENSINLQEYLAGYFQQQGIEEVPEFKILKPNELPDNYKKQFEAFDDKRLDGLRIAIVPKLWKPSESHADRRLIIINQEYFEDEKNRDRVQWFSHEIGHCQKFLDSPETYFKDMETPAFEDIVTYADTPRKELELELSQLTEHGGDEKAIAYLKNMLESSTGDIIKIPISYPNNKVEQHAFKRQFQSTKNMGVTKEEVIGELKKYYQDRYDAPFFDRMLDSVYG
ncbi:MAG: GNAT family N-acetyltransferase [Patescibacteria group bacterium]